MKKGLPGNPRGKPMTKSDIGGRGRNEKGERGML